SPLCPYTTLFRSVHLPPLLGGVAFVHAKQVPREQRCLVAAGAGANLEDHGALVHGIRGKESELDLLLERGAPLLELWLLGGSHRPHFGVGGGIRDEGI